MEYVNTTRAKLQCEKMFNDLHALNRVADSTDIHAIDTSTGANAFNALHDAIEAFIKLRNSL